jgi:predicted transcriptional regulator
MMVRRIGNVRVTKRAMHFEEDKEGSNLPYNKLYRCFRGKAWKLEKLKPISMLIHCG